MFFLIKYIVVWMTTSAFVQSTTISNLNLIFETFNPESMVRFYEFNDKGYNITDGCIQDMFLYLDGVHRDIFWAVKLSDASGYYSGGIYTGNEIRHGDPILCRELNLEFYQNYQLNDHPETLNQSIIPFPVRMVVATYKMIVENSPFRVNNIVQSVCLPTSCSYHDLIQVMSYTFHMPNLRTAAFVNNAELVKLRIMNGPYEFYEDNCFYVLGVLWCFILLLSASAWLYEHFTNINDLLRQRHQQDLYTTTRNNTINTQSAINQLTKLNNCDQPNCLTELKMDPLAESMTVNNIHTNKHVNLVQVKKIKMENSATISLDIIAGKCDYMNCADKDIQSCKSISSLRKTLLAFSFSQNFRCLVSRNQTQHNEIAVVCGVQVICIMWIILIHTWTVLFYVCALSMNTCVHFIFEFGSELSYKRKCGFCVKTFSEPNHCAIRVLTDNKIYKFNKHNHGIMASILSNGSFSIDTYFFLSGVTIAHTFYKTIKNVINDHSVGDFDQVIHFAVMILHKVLRLIFPYLVVLLMLQIIMKYFCDHSIIDIPSQDHITCQDNMWRNILFIDTFFPIHERCMPWSWFISLECQFFVAATIILLIANNHPRFATVICLSFFISSFVTTTIIRYNKKSKSSLSYEEQIAEFNSVYDQPWIRIAPYLLGMCLGYILFKTKETIRINICVVITGWIATVLLLCGITFRNLFLAKTNLWIESSVSSITHTVWPMILFWIILTSVSQHQGFLGRFLCSENLIPLSKLSNCILLIHPLITRVILLGSEQTFHLSIYILLTMYTGFLVLIFAAGFILYMFFEAPITSLLENIYHKNLI